MNQLYCGKRSASITVNRIFFLLFFFGTLTAQSQNLISVSFSNGFVGDENGTNKAVNAVYLNSLGWSNIQFAQNSPSGVFVAQGNDIIGSVLITDYSGVQHTIPGFIKWRAPSGSVTTIVFEPSASETLTTSSGSYTIKGNTLSRFHTLD